jgi:hypothetical protein
MDHHKILATLKGLVAVNKELVDELCRLINVYQDPATPLTSVEAPFEFTETPGTYVQVSMPTVKEMADKLDAISLAGKVDNPNSKENSD